MIIPPIISNDISRVTPLIGEIMITWSTAEETLGRSLESLYGVNRLHPKDGAELVHAIDLRKKFDLVQSLKIRGRLTGRQLDLAPEMKWINNNLRKGRNIIAHGSLLFHETGEPYCLWSSSAIAMIEAKHLELLLQHARYAAHICQRFAWGESVDFTPGLAPYRAQLARPALLPEPD